MKQDIEFYSEGSLIKGHLYLPGDIEEKENLPAIVLCHGFAGVKELLLPAYAEAFSENGFAALTFDYRGFGESEGEAGKLSPRLQIVDIRGAITYMQSLKEVDPAKIGLWGTSYGGANAVITAAKDERVKCLAVQLTFADGERVITGNLSQEEKDKLLATLMKVWTKAVTRNQMMKLPVNKALTDEQSIAFFNKAMEEFPQLNVKIPFFTIKETIEHKPVEYIGKVRVPVSIVGAENDSVNPAKESEILYEHANEPKELFMVKGATHYEVYEGELFQQVIKKQLEWFGKYLS
jgi:dipeptidyl aminopeptidase/acylaminoacyl peptidase